MITQKIHKQKTVYVLSHWDEGVMGVYNKINDAKFRVQCEEGEYYKSFYKSSKGWGYKTGGYYIEKMSIDEAEILCRWN